MTTRHPYSEKETVKMVALMLGAFALLAAVWLLGTWLLSLLAGDGFATWTWSYIYNYWVLLLALGLSVYGGCDETIFRFHARGDENEVRFDLCSWLFLLYFFSPIILNWAHYLALFAGYPHLGEKLFEMRFYVLDTPTVLGVLAAGFVSYLVLSHFSKQPWQEAPTAR